MSRKLLGGANPLRSHELFFTSMVVCLLVLVLACTQDSADRAAGAAEQAQGPPEPAQGPAEHARIVELREAEHKTVRHPEKRYYSTIWPDGLQVSFETAQGHFGSYTFPKGEFPPGEPVFLSCPGSPDLLPLRVVRLNGDADQRYRIEWLAESPVVSEGAHRVVRSY